MKKPLIIALLAASAQLAQAQSIPAGTISLGGNIGYFRNTIKGSVAGPNNATNSFETKTSQFSLAPSVGYFVADNLAIGLTLGYQAYNNPYSTYTPAPSTVRAQLDPNTTFRIGAFAQYYKMLSEQFGFVGTLGGGLQSAREYKYTSNSSSALISETKGSGFMPGLRRASSFFPFPNWD